MDKFNEAYTALIDSEYFSEEALQLLTNIVGSTLQTLDAACAANYGLSLEDILGSDYSA